MCRENIISLNIRQFSDPPEPAQTALSSQENYFLRQAGLLVSRRSPIVPRREQLVRFVTSKFESSHRG